MINPTPAVAVLMRNSRRLTLLVVGSSIGCCLLIQIAGGELDGGPNSNIGRAAADIPLQRQIDVLIIRLRVSRQEGCNRHDLPGLAVATLWNLQFVPCCLNGLARSGAKPFDRRNAQAFSLRGS